MAVVAMHGSALVQLTISSDSIVVSSYHAGCAGQRTVALSTPTTNIVGAGNAGKSASAVAVAVTVAVAVAVAVGGTMLASAAYKFTKPLP